MVIIKANELNEGVGLPPPRSLGGRLVYGCKVGFPRVPWTESAKAALNRCFWKCIEIKWRKRSVVLYSECGGVEAFVNLLTTLDQVKWEPNKIPRPS